MSVSPATSLTESYGSWVFNDAVMRERLPKGAYKSLRSTIDDGATLDPANADVIANAMKDWALELGATHFCHWFQPLTGSTAEKHDAFLNPTSKGGAVLEFSGKELIQGEPDASSFPNGGLRATFEARGYTAWDCTSPVFVKQDGQNRSLFIPTAFCSYTGEALDQKTPLLRSMDALNKQAMRVLRALGNTTSKRVSASLGGEQEYFLIDKKFLESRLDLRLTSRTLFGAPAPKGQEMEDHYFGSLHERIGSFMEEFNAELWKLGVSAKTQHNEVAPAQYELAPVYATVNVAVDHNHLIMETMQEVADRHGFFCTLHEKPFAGVNGSGKHNNWSIGTDDGINLLNPGKTPHDNAQFLAFLMAVVRAVDKYQTLLRASVANAGNDHRLGANEAPPAIISIFMGDQLTDIMTQLEKGAASSSIQGGSLVLGASTLPTLPKDNTDRNRTSPFAFTGNKFEFRMAASSQSLSMPNYVLNTITADALCDMANELEGATNVTAKLQEILSRYAKDHKRIVFNGNGYSEEWVVEAQKRGLANLKNTPDALKCVMNPENVAVFIKHGVLTNGEIHSRFDITMETYSKLVNIEGKTSLYILNRQIIPAMLTYAGELAASANAIKTAGVSAAPQLKLLNKVNALLGDLQEKAAALSAAVNEAGSISSAEQQAYAMRDKVMPAMSAARVVADELETMVDSDVWPLPSYAEMLFDR
jgi:glutamine synthetase